MKKINQTFIYSLVAFLLFSCSSELKNWEVAKNTGTIEALEEYIENSPKSKYRVEADSIIRQLHYIADSIDEHDFFQSAMESDSIQQLKSYIAQYPQGFFIDSVDQKVFELFQSRWEDTKMINTLQSYKDFISLEPQEPFQKLASSKISLMELLSSGKYSKIKDYNGTVTSFIKNSVVSLAFDGLVETPGMYVQSWMIRGFTPDYGPGELAKGMRIKAYTGIDRKTNDWEVLFIETPE